MTDDRFQRAREIFDHVEPMAPAERQSYLDQHAASDPDLLKEVESLLAVRDRVGGFLDTTSARWIGRKIGSYTIQGLISEGGMGVVLQAEQDQPQRKVAVKLIKGPVFSASTQQRFMREAEVLGRLDHPGIANIHDAGIDEQGGQRTPYIVMEYIEGLGLLEHADKMQMDVQARVQLMVSICDAVNHAHLRGVVHRDLKPSNVLVRPEGQPKVLDFGIARITDSDLQLTTMRTDVGQILGTLPYMSPEQISGRQDELDLRSDIYSLGVLLYELLTGRLPQDLSGTEILEAARLIVDQSPAALGNETEKYSDDLETIVAKCLRKEPERRYSSAADLAADLRRYLNDETILARPSTAVYQLKKFAKRNRTAVVLASVAVAILCAGLIVSLAGWSAANRSGREAELAAAEAQSLSDFLVDLISAPDPFHDGADVLVVDLLDNAAEKADESRDTNPRLAAKIHQVLAETYRSLGVYPAAINQQESALRIYEEVAPSLTDTSLVYPLIKLVNLHLDLYDFAAADSVFERIATISPDLPSDSWDRFRLAQSLGSRYDMGNEFDKAVAVLEPALADAQAALGPDHVMTVDIQASLANVLWQLDEPERARDMFNATLVSLRKEGGENNPEALAVLNNLAMIYQQLDDMATARDIFQEALAAKKVVFGPTHPRVALSHHNLAHTLRELGDYDAAMMHHETGIAIIDTIPAVREPRIFFYKVGYARTLHVLNRLEEARATYEECYPPLAASYGADHTRLVAIAASLAEICEALNDTAAVTYWQARSVPTSE